MSGVAYTPVDPSTLLAAIPKPSSATPASEATGGNAGTDPQKFSMDGHAHPRLTSVVVGTVASGNTAAIAFTRSFISEPGIDYQELPATSNTTTPPTSDTDANAQPTNCKVVAWTKGPTALLPNAPAAAFTGCVVRIWRSQTVPQNLVSLLLGGVFNLFSASVVGTRFSLIAVARSDAAAS